MDVDAPIDDSCWDRTADSQVVLGAMVYKAEQ